MKTIFTYLKNNNIPFNLVRTEIQIKRDHLSHDLRSEVINNGLNIFELDTTIIIF